MFCTEDGSHGNLLGVVLDGASVPAAERQRLATHLGFAETVFVDDPAGGRIRIFTPAAELPFAGHPTVGTGWLLRQEGHETSVLRPPAGEVGVSHAGDLTWIRAHPDWAPDITIRREASPAAVDQLQGSEPGVDFLYAWAWEDEAAGQVRSRAFPQGLGIAEDEATGSAAVVLTSMLGRALTIRQGRGSVLLGRPAADGMAEVGGRVRLDHVREDAWA